MFKSSLDGYIISKKNKVSMNDDGSLLFPSITICKDEMFDNLKHTNRGLLPCLQSGEVSSENAKSWFRNRTFPRARLVKFLSIKTVEGSHQNNYPCNAARGPRAGEPCSFPFLHPDCSLMKKSGKCTGDPGITMVKYEGCYNDKDTTWCSTRTYHNRSHIMGDWGYCSRRCTTWPASCTAPGGRRASTGCTRPGTATPSTRRMSPTLV